MIRRLRAEGRGIRRAVAVSGEPLRGRDAEGLDVVLPRPYPFDHLLLAISHSRYENAFRRVSSEPIARSDGRRSWWDSLSSSSSPG